MLASLALETLQRDFCHKANIYLKVIPSRVIFLLTRYIPIGNIPIIKRG